MTYEFFKYGKNKDSRMSIVYNEATNRCFVDEEYSKGHMVEWGHRMAIRINANLAKGVSINNIVIETNYKTDSKGDSTGEVRGFSTNVTQTPFLSFGIQKDVVFYNVGTDKKAEYVVFPMTDKIKKLYDEIVKEINRG